jgi:predicted PurR-regulated permease PerM
MDNTVKRILMIFLIVLIFSLLKELSTILIPLALAFIIASIFYPIVNLFSKRKASRILVLPTVAIITVIIVFLLGQVIYQAINEIIQQQDYFITSLNDKIKQVIGFINSIIYGTFGTKIKFTSLAALLNKDTFNWLASILTASIGPTTGAFVMFILYYIVILIGMTGSKEYLSYVAGGNNSMNIVKSFETIQKSIASYIALKTLINLAVGILVTVICILFGVNFAYLFGLLTFLLFYIPTIGSIVAPIFPTLMAIIQFNSFEKIFFFLLIIIVIQAIIANIIEHV